MVSIPSGLTQISLFHLIEGEIVGSLSCNLFEEKPPWCMLALRRAQNKHRRSHPEGGKREYQESGSDSRKKFIRAAPALSL